MFSATNCLGRTGPACHHPEEERRTRAKTRLSSAAMCRWVSAAAPQKDLLSNQFFGLTLSATSPAHDIVYDFDWLLFCFHAVPPATLSSRLSARRSTTDLVGDTWSPVPPWNRYYSSHSTSDQFFSEPARLGGLNLDSTTSLASVWTAYCVLTWSASVLLHSLPSSLTHLQQRLWSKNKVAIQSSGCSK